MEFVSEDYIYHFLNKIEENEAVFVHLQNKIIKEQLLINAILTDENLDVLKEDEYDLIWFIVVVIIGAIKDAVKSDIPALDKRIYQNWEEVNWKLWNETKAADFREKLNPFFKNYPQEDLLAFLEDSLESDEEMEINPVAQEITFVISKSLIDTFQEMIK
jgi:hypothetical protein